MTDTRPVLLIATNRTTTPHPVYPIGVSGLANILTRAGFGVRALDLCFEEAPLVAIDSALKNLNPLFVGVSIRAIDDVSSIGGEFFLPEIKSVVATVKNCASCPLVVGGSGYSLLPATLVEYLDADAGVFGEAEDSILLIAMALSSGRSLSGLPGVHVPGSRTVAPKLSPALLAPSDWGQPAYTLFPIRPYLDCGGVASVQTQRGCAERCSYCTYPLIEGRRHRLQSRERIAEDLSNAFDEGARDFFVTDSVFNSDLEHAMGVCSEFQSLPTLCRWSAFVKPNRTLPELAQAMARSGSWCVEVGSEAATPETLEGLGKCHAPEDILRADKALFNAGIAPAHYFIFGGPNETQDTVQRSLELIHEIGGPCVAFCGIRIFPMTQIHRRALEERVVARTESLLKPRYYFSQTIDIDWLRQELSNFASSHPRFFIDGMQTNRNERMLERLRERGRHGSLWEYA